MQAKIQSILIIEDEAIIGMALAADLEDAGYQVVDICPSGEEAVEIIKTSRVDLVILDVKLGMGMDGLQTLTKIRMHANPIIIVVSGNSDAITAQRIQEQKVDYFFVKPLNINALLLQLQALN